MATPVHGNLKEFQPENELFSSYLERVELFFNANDIVDEKKVAVFLSVVGSKTYSLLRNLLAPDLPSTKTLAALVGTLKNHFEPKPLVIAERFHFHQRTQNVGESIAEYIAELRRLTTYCVNEVNEVASHKACGRCGRTSHDPKDCYYRNATCYNCGKRGHIAEVCRSGKIPRPRQASPRARPSPKNMREARKPQYGTKYVAAAKDDHDELSVEADQEFLPLQAVGGSTTPPYKVPLDVVHTMELQCFASWLSMCKVEMALINISISN